MCDEECVVIYRWYELVRASRIARHTRATVWHQLDVDRVIEPCAKTFSACIRHRGWCASFILVVLLLSLLSNAPAVFSVQSEIVKLFVVDCDEAAFKTTSSITLLDSQYQCTLLSRDLSSTSSRHISIATTDYHRSELNACRISLSHSSVRSMGSDCSESDSHQTDLSMSNEETKSHRCVQLHAADDQSNCQRHLSR